MIKLNPSDIIKENKESKKSEHIQKPSNEDSGSRVRPDVVDAKVYKLKSAFVKNSVFITLSYVNVDGVINPIEIFINSKDLTKTSEYVVLTRLISAIFRSSRDPKFILEELQGISDPNGGSFKGGKYYHSFYSEIADVIKLFFHDVKIIEQPINPTTEKISNTANTAELESAAVDLNAEFRICPTCSGKSLKTENGCDTCVECGYSKCDK
mgnify:CR=1 FL=1